MEIKEMKNLKTLFIVAIMIFACIISITCITHIKVVQPPEGAFSLITIDENTFYTVKHPTKKWIFTPIHSIQEIEYFY
jgi:hypothetical protein